MKSLIVLSTLLVCDLSYGFELKGTAKTMNTNTIVYIENHSIVEDENGYYKKIQSVYTDPDGVVIAKMTSDFSKNRMVPETKFEDLRFDKIESLYFQSDDKLIFEIQEKDKDKKSKSIKYSSDMVAGQGFDNFVKKNFNGLQKKSVQLNFGVLASMSFFQFKGQSIRSKSDDGIVKFGISLSNPFLRLFVKELVVDYEEATKVLKTYRGLSNLPDKNRKSQLVQIDYESVYVK